MFTFPSEHRVRTKTTFDEVFAEGVKFVTRELVVIRRKRTEADGPRIGIIVTRKVGNSVERNRIKRQVREAFRHLRPELLENPKTAALDVVVIARQGAKDVSAETIAKALKRGCAS